VQYFFSFYIILIALISYKNQNYQIISVKLFSYFICKMTKTLSVQLLSRVRLFATPWIAARQASLSITNSRSSLKLRLAGPKLLTKFVRKSVTVLQMSTENRFNLWFFFFFSTSVNRFFLQVFLQQFLNNQSGLWRFSIFHSKTFVT